MTMHLYTYIITVFCLCEYENFTELQIQILNRDTFVKITYIPQMYVLECNNNSISI